MSTSLLLYRTFIPNIDNPICTDTDIMLSYFSGLVVDQLFKMSQVLNRTKFPNYQIIGGFYLEQLLSRYYFSEQQEVPTIAILAIK